MYTFEFPTYVLHDRVMHHESPLHRMWRTMQAIATQDTPCTWTCFTPAPVPVLQAREVQGRMQMCTRILIRSTYPIKALCMIMTGNAHVTMNTNAPERLRQTMQTMNHCCRSRPWPATSTSPLRTYLDLRVISRSIASHDHIYTYIYVYVNVNYNVYMHISISR
jgi:hypothetical protein